MKKYLLSILLVLMLVLVGCSKNEQENPNLGNENFAIEFLKLENKKENIIYSPLSIKYALNMLNEGALGNTKDEIEKVIKNLTLTKYENYESNLSLANAIFIKDTYTSSVKESYINALTTKYNAEVHNDSFTNASNINNFVKSKTLGLIEKLLDDKDVQDEYLKMILINALGINMEWVEQFKTTSTGGYDFTLASGEKIKATTMHKKSSSDTTAYYKGNDIVALKMDLKKYGSTELEFIAIMPENLEEYVTNLKYEDINNIKSNLVKASAVKEGIVISIPKFKYDYQLELKKDLESLGIKEVFDPNNANLGNMSEDKLHVSNVVHMATIEFSEEGIKAAAVTAIMVDANSSIQVQEPEEVVLDHPFIYIIDDKATGEVWFVGTMYEPNLWANDEANY